MTVLEFINVSADYLEKKGIESPRLNAELLLASVISCRRFDLYLLFDRPLDEEEKSQYRELLKRRSKFEPLQYILGEVEFYGYPIKVNNSVLIPRPETEILIDALKENIHKEPVSILDIGTGSGNIAIAAAKIFPGSMVTTIDVSEEALSLAEGNAILNCVKERIIFKRLDILNEGLNEKFDVIVSNPPYIAESEYTTLQPELTIYEPKIALTDFGDGYRFYREISARASSMLNTGGKLFFEVGAGQAETVKSIMEPYGFNNIKFKKDYLNINRVVYGEIE